MLRRLLRSRKRWRLTTERSSDCGRTWPGRRPSHKGHTLQRGRVHLGLSLLYRHTVIIMKVASVRRTEVHHAH